MEPLEDAWRLLLLPRTHLCGLQKVPRASRSAALGARVRKGFSHCSGKHIFRAGNVFLASLDWPREGAGKGRWTVDLPQI